MHVITGLDTGGAEMMLCKVLQQTHREIRSGVVSLLGRGSLAPGIEALGVPVTYLGMLRGSVPNLSGLQRLTSAARNFRPTHIQGWMYHGNLAATLVSPFMRPRPKLLWNVRQTLYSLDRESRLTGALIRLSSYLSRKPDLIIYNSELSADQHEHIGFSAARRVLIPNGFDLDRFRPAVAARSAIRNDLGIEPDGVVVGHIARFHPMKGHLVMLEAASQVVQRFDKARFVFAGSGMDGDNIEIRRAIDRLDLRSHVTLLGERTDVDSLLAAMDVVVLPSLWGDAFPNAIGEAMAAGVPCVVSDIGDVRALVGDCGKVVAPGDVCALASAICELIESDPNELKRLSDASRQHIANHFSLSSVGAMYRDLYLRGA